MAAHVSCVVGAAFIATWDIWRFPQQKWGLRGARAALFAENSQINAVPAAGTTRSEASYYSRDSGRMQTDRLRRRDRIWDWRDRCPRHCQLAGFSKPSQ